MGIPPMEDMGINSLEYLGGGKQMSKPTEEPELLTREGIAEIMADNCKMGNHVPLGNVIACCEETAKAEHQKDKQHYEQEIKKLTGEIYILQEEIRIFKQKRLDRPDREKIEEILFNMVAQHRHDYKLSPMRTNWNKARRVVKELYSGWADQILALFDTGLEVAKCEEREKIQVDLKPLMAEALDISDWSFVQEYVRNLSGLAQGK